MDLTIKYINKNWGLRYYLPVIILIVVGAATSSRYQFGPWIGLAGLAWLIGGYGWAASKAREEFMRQFAESHGFVYVSSEGPGMMLGNLLHKGNEKSRTISNMVEGQHSEHRVRFFFYSYTVGSGDSKRTYSYTVSEIFFNGHSPDIVIESRSDWDFISYAGNHQKEMPVEGFFKKYFAVFVPEDFEIETLELFTPDVMEYLINNAKNYNFEFVEDRLYIFRQGLIENNKEMDVFLANSQYMIDKLAPKIFRLQDDVAAIKKLI